MRTWNGSWLVSAAAVALLLLTGAAGAQQPEHGHGGHAPRAAPYAAHYDTQFNHNHYYYSGGVWYAPRGPTFVVVGPPVGVFVPVLPPFYTTVWFGGLPYYYANDAYYTYAGPQGYEVVEPPADPNTAITGPQGPAYPGAPPPSENGPPPQGEDIFVYPQQGQSPEQQANDRYECHKWASSQTGFDPTQAGGGVAPDQTVARGEDYRRAMRACLEGRGYSVR